MLKDLQKRLRTLRSEMRAQGVKKISPFNGGLDRLTYQMNAHRFELETRIKNEKDRLSLSADQIAKIERNYIEAMQRDPKLD